MRVLVVTNMYPTVAEPWFGAFVREGVEALGRAGVDTEVIAFDGRTRRRNYASAASAVRARVSADRFDVVHAHYGLTGVPALAQRRIPVVTTFHGSDAHIPWQRAVSRIVAKSSVPVVVSRSVAYRIGAPDATVVPTGVDTRLFRPMSRESARVALGWPQELPVVLLPGARANAAKGAPLFDAALDLVRRDVPDVLGVSLEGYERSAVPVVMNAASVLLMTSVSEGSPVAVKEALACNTPVVSVNVGDVAEVVDSLPACAVIERSPRALADAVVAALLAERSDALRRRALDYDTEAVVGRLIDVFEAAGRRDRCG